MARLTSDGNVKQPMPGVPGLHQAWQDLGAWLDGELRDQRIRLILVRQGDPGGGHSHSDAWQHGYALAVANALIVVKRALGITGSDHVKDRPNAGTDKGNGYDAGLAAVRLALSRLEP